jgi:hypothetical protein
MQMTDLNQAITNLDLPKYNLDTCSMLVEFNAPMWTARKLDKGTTEEVRQSKGAKAKGAARVNKHLLAGTSELDGIITFVQNVRKYVAHMTLPWADRGARLLPTAKFLEFDEQMRKYEEEFVTKVNNFLQIYPSLITAQAMALGAMFNRAEFPDVKEVARKFAFRVTYMPLPTAGDFRVDVGVAAQEELKARLNEVYARRVGEAVDEVRVRLSEAVKHLAEQLTVDYVGKEAKPRRFYESTLEAAQNLCDLVPALNITNDPKVEAIRADLERIVGGIGVETIRNDIPAREEIKKEVDDLASRLDF